MSAPVIERWLNVIENGQTADLDDMLAEDAVFYSPAVFTPQHGRAKAAAYLRAAEHMFAGTGFHYVNTWIDTHSAVLEFAAEVDGISIEGVDILHWNDEGQLTSVKVMVRPFKALQVVIAKMAELLAAQ
ncbi:MAG: nuclear transport factor 2 family protein [Actinomycetes bacterium]